MSDARSSKRQRVDRGSHHDRVELTNDFEVINAREVRVVEHGRLPRETPRSPQKGRTTWMTGVFWAPVDNPEFALDPDGDWYDIELNAPIADAAAFQDAPPVKIKKKKTMRSVRFISIDIVLAIY